ncbi:peptidylprolyl isomerase [Mycobacterium sp. 1274761.0]|uniref:peptidylprolyl isomerase n=1 Tax=Mycobacterium sp. 1274761.0 TaxID=1834077 RepID=UPI0007FC2B06|nr:peptidylprolyl isomerase [Mycobacterium sp. 1274761.0]OBK78244.1 cyclophilin [Mycobacterium sp. 1274761.0]
MTRPYGAYPPPPYDPYGYPPPRPTNGMAIASLICAFVFAPLGIVFGHISLSQIKRTGEEGHGLAVAGLVISYLVTIGSIIVLIAAVLFTAAVARELNDESRFDAGITAAPAPDDGLPEFEPPPNLGADCAYPTTAERASKPNTPPRSGRVPTDPVKVSASVSTNRGNIGLQLDNGKAPCTVNSFASLSQQGYFDDTTCHRLTTSPQLGVLQCGDPSGTGTGGPGYRFNNEYPTNQYRLSDPALKTPVTYPRGTLAMANAGSGTNGSQFFLVYADSMLPPTYTAFGTIDATGLATLDKVAAAGVDRGGDDGKPAMDVTIKSIRLD